MTTTADTSAALGDRPPMSELPTAAVLASWAYLRFALRQPQTLTAALGGLVAAVLALAAITQRWQALLALPAIGAVGLTAMFAALVLARRGGNRVLLYSQTPTGRAGLILHYRTGPDGPDWLLDNMWARPRGRQQLERAQRPGAVLLRRAITLADEHDMPLQLVAADQTLATKVYLPAGFDYADDRQRTRRRPRMILPPTTR